VGQTASVLAYAHDAKDDRARAEKMFRLALATDERAYDSRHPPTVTDRQALAEFLERIRSR
jgi:hypothetical protein